MRRILLPLALCFAFLWPAAAAEPVIRYVELDGPITGASVHRVLRALDTADAQGEECVLIRMDTPGGLAAAMEKTVKRMLGARTPIVVWVGPSGARAASAGFFLLMAADVAAMAPGTRTGAASVIYGMGKKSTDQDVLLRKANQDAAALIRSIAEHRGRDVKAAEEAVLNAEAYTDDAAMKRHLIDLVARDREDLLKKLDGRKIRRFDGTEVTLVTAGAHIVQATTKYRQRILELLADPQVAYILFLLGLLGLYVEFTHPGLILPGLVGAFCLILFAFSVQMLPVSAIGMLLILLAVAMFILEIKVTSYGMLTFGGLVSLVIGSLMLFRGPVPELRLSLGFVLPISVLLAAIFVVILWLAVRAQRAKVDTGVEGLEGEIGTVTRALEPRGTVFIHGEIWDAVSTADAVAEGKQVRVVGVQHMMLTVEPVERSAERGR